MIREENMNMVAIKDKNGRYVHYKVCEEVYLYIRQLETYINYPEKSKLKEVYSERFNKCICCEPREKK